MQALIFTVILTTLSRKKVFCLVLVKYYIEDYSFTLYIWILKDILGFGKIDFRVVFCFLYSSEIFWAKRKCGLYIDPEEIVN